MADEGDTEFIAADELHGPGASGDGLFVALANQPPKLLHLLHCKRSVCARFFAFLASN